MLYTINYKDGSKKTILDFKPLTNAEIETQLQERPDCTDIICYDVFTPPVYLHNTRPRHSHSKQDNQRHERKRVVT